MHLELLDWIIIAATLFVCFLPALFFGRRAGKNTSEFFASGRSVPWWLAGLSMVATTFSSDTPNLVTNFVRTHGVAGNWVWWALVLTGVSTVFFYARLVYRLYNYLVFVIRRRQFPVRQNGVCIFVVGRFSPERCSAAAGGKHVVEVRCPYPIHCINL